MSRPPAPTALRWLLVVATLAGLGIWQGGHCAGDMTAGSGGHRPATAPVAMGDGAAAHQVSPDAHRHEHGQSPGEKDRPGTSADLCQDRTAAVASVVVTVAVREPDGVRIAVAARRVPPVKQRTVPGVTLAHIGVSRT